ncbi:MAG: septal ring lytic transglycosylase RlpA family protein [Nitrospirae bacterium]|nr:septal ring lytic transglycosylase RlpA family protein [Nitrospirota bacterium]
MKRSTSLSNRSLLSSVLVVLLTVMLYVGLFAVPSEAKKTEAKKYAAASWYGKEYHGRRTSSGIIYDMNSSQAAHKTLPFGTNLKVTNPKNGKSTKVKITDRGPFTKSRDIDLSYKCAKDIGMVNSGVAKVKIDYIIKDGSKTKYVDITDMKTLPARLDKIAFLDYKNAAIMKRMIKGSQHAHIIKSTANGHPVYIVTTRETDTKTMAKSTVKSKLAAHKGDILLTGLKSKLDRSKDLNMVALMSAYDRTLVKPQPGLKLPTVPRSSGFIASAAHATARLHS